jgi:hypothetical protein
MLVHPRSLSTKKKNPNLTVGDQTSNNITLWGIFLLLIVGILELLIFFSQISTCTLPFEKSELNPAP